MSEFGPHDYWSDDKPTSRGQHKAIAELAVSLLGLPEPKSRYDGSVLIARLREAHKKQDDNGRAAGDLARRLVGGER